MTRKEQVKEYLQTIGNGEMTGIPFDAGFECGVEWADSHPHWISVEDELPKIKHSADNMKYSDTVIVTNGKYRISARWVHNTWAGWYGWYDDGDEELKGITHWMPLPAPPMKGDQGND